MTDFCAAILAGGKSNRFGHDKAMLSFNGITLLDRIFNELLSITHDIWVIGDRRENSVISSEKFLTDIFDNIGPLGGLFTILSHSSKPILLTPCDMPFLNYDHLQFLIDKYNPNYDATIAVSKAGIEPLVGFYEPHVKPLVEECIKSKIFAMYRFIDKLDVNFVTFKDQDDVKDLFFNINSFSDYKMAVNLQKKFDLNNSPPVK
jgi:molybdopterin-guanine dinucleotide biosynthesis protein A